MPVGPGHEVCVLLNSDSTLLIFTHAVHVPCLLQSSLTRFPTAGLTFFFLLNYLPEMRVNLKRKFSQITRLVFHKRCLLVVLFVCSLSMISLFYLLQWNIICLNIDIENRLNNLVSNILTHSNYLVYKQINNI